METNTMDITKTNVTVLSTSDIMTMEEPAHQYAQRTEDGAIPSTKYGLRAALVLDNGDITRFWTTGVLERALELGYTVWIVSTRTKLGPHDQWWTKLVPGSQTILYGPRLHEWSVAGLTAYFKTVILGEDCLERLPEFLEGPSLPYLVWARGANLVWPLELWDETGEEEIEPHAFPMHWTSALTHFRKAGILAPPSTFKQDWPTAVPVQAKPAPSINWFGEDEDEEPIRNGACLSCGCASGECECHGQ